MGLVYEVIATTKLRGEENEIKDLKKKGVGKTAGKERVGNM